MPAERRGARTGRSLVDRCGSGVWGVWACRVQLATLGRQFCWGRAVRRRAPKEPSHPSCRFRGLRLRRCEKAGGSGSETSGGAADEENPQLQSGKYTLVLSGTKFRENSDRKSVPHPGAGPTDRDRKRFPHPGAGPTDRDRKSFPHPGTKDRGNQIKPCMSHDAFSRVILGDFGDLGWFG